MKKVFLLLLTVAIISSCKKTDREPPVITSGSLTEMQDTIRNSVAFNLVAIDNSDIEKIELYVNDSLIASDKTGSFSYNLNTLELNDGTYILKIVVYDQHGNTTTSSKSVVVSNSLLTLKLGELYNNPYMAVVSDESGNKLGTAEMVKNSEIKIMPSAPFSESAINFVYYIDAPGWSPITAYTHVKRGSTYHLDLFSPGITAKGVKLHLSYNDTTQISKIQISTDQAYYTLNSLSDTVNLPNTLPYTTGHKMLIQVWATNGVFFHFFTIEDLSSISVDLAIVNIPEAGYTINFSGLGNANCIISGITSNSDVKNHYYISGFNSIPGNSWIDVYVPYDNFTLYNTFLQFTPSGSNKSYIETYRGQIPLNMSLMDASLQLSGTSPADFSATSAGSYDYYIIQYYNSTNTAGLQVFSPAGQNSWKLPDLVTAFGNNKLSYDNFSPVQLTLTNFSQLDWQGKFYDISTDIEQVNLTDPHSQTVFINLTGKRK
jgi:hypothetical protein